MIGVEYDLWSGYHRQRCLVFGLSSSEMIRFWVISVEDQLVFGLPASQMDLLRLVWVISVEDDLF